MRTFHASLDGGYYVDWTPEEIAAHEADLAASAEVENISVAKERAQQLLSASDWTQIPNCGLTLACAADYTMYRSQLRAIRITPTPSPEWPVEPTRIWE